MTKALDASRSSDDFFSAYQPRAAPNTPKYQQLRFAVLEAIRAGHWADGAKLPTEEELVGITGFSLGTVQRAVRMLADDGVIERRQGIGTFVSRANSKISEPWHFQFSADDGETLLPAFPKIVARERTHQRGAWSKFLKQDEVLRIDRIVNVNHEFSAFSRFFVSGTNAAIMEKRSFDELNGANFRVVLSDARRIPVTEVKHNVSSLYARGEYLEKLGCGRLEPLIKIEIAAIGGRDIPMYFQELVFPHTERKLLLPSLGRSH